MRDDSVTDEHTDGGSERSTDCGADQRANRRAFCHSDVSAVGNALLDTD